jgi:hypothetical protein
VVPREVCNKDCGRKNGKRLQEIDGRTIHAARDTFQWRHHFFTIPGRPPVAILEADEMGCGYEMNNSQRATQDEYVNFVGHANGGV